MANSLREVKIRINATKNTAQITKAMYMVSQSKVKNAEKIYSNYRDFMARIGDMVASVVNNIDDNEVHPMMVQREIKKTAYLIVTSDRGLAGAYNSNVLKEFQTIIADSHKSKDEYVCASIGKQGYNFFKKNDEPLITDSIFQIRDDVVFSDMLPLANAIIDMYEKAEIDRLVVIYNHYINSLTQEVIAKTILPISEIEGKVSPLEYVFESGLIKTINTILPMYIEDIIYGIVLDAKISEHCARRNAMRTATDNAKEVIAKLQLLYNRVRQEAITSEIIDVIGGANAVGGKK